MVNDACTADDPHRWKIDKDWLHLNTTKFAPWLWERDVSKKVGSADDYWLQKKQALLFVKTGENTKANLAIKLDVCAALGGEI